MANNTDILQICRTCMNVITDASFLYLDCIPAANTHLTIKQTLYSCVPEVDFNIVLNPVMCCKCVNNLLSDFEFKKNCLQSEVQINKYIQQIQHTGDLNLLDVLQFHQPSIKSLDTIEVKIEDLENTEDFKNEDLVCDTSGFNEASKCTDSTEPKYLLKLQKVETEDVLFNTFDDYNINYNLSAGKEKSDAHNSSAIAQNCLPEAFECQSYSKNLNKTNAYYQCYRCRHKAKNKLKLILHLKHHTRKKLYEEIISKKLSKYKNLICYYRCSLCSYLTKYKCLFDFHIRIHLLKKNYTKHIFKHANVHNTKAIRTTIKVSRTNINVNKRKLVANCNKYYKHSFKSPRKSKKPKQDLSHCNSLKPNVRAHIVKNLFKCSICKYQFSHKNSLKRHVLIHTGKKSFSCSVCEYQCNRKSNLKEHIRIHTGEKPFPCSVCKYRCNQKSLLKRHILIHTGKKPFSCSVCKYQCSQQGHLNQHMLIHTEKKSFSCSVCEYQCNRKSNLKKHFEVIQEKNHSHVLFANTSLARKIT